MNLRGKLFCATLAPALFGCAAFAGEFRFQHHYIDRNLPGDSYGQTCLVDVDKDGDPDVFTVEMEGIPGALPPRWFIWENVDGKGATFVERVILDNALGGHEAVAADVDGDGDLDICSKLWRPRKDNVNEGRNHADFVENLLIRK